MFKFPFNFIKSFENILVDGLMKYKPNFLSLITPDKRKITLLNNIGISNYCSEFTSVINQNNVYGVQFHPEKSLEHGLQIIKNFLEI